MCIFIIEMKKCICEDCPNCNGRVHQSFSIWNNCKECKQKMCDQCFDENANYNRCNECNIAICKKCQFVCQYCEEKMILCSNCTKMSKCNENIISDECTHKCTHNW